MRSNEIYIAQPATEEQSNALKTFMEKLKIKFDISIKDSSPYNTEFVNKIKMSRKQIEYGDYEDLKQSDINKLLDQ